LLMVLYNGTVRRSDDGGGTWTTLGRAPVPDEAGYSAKVAVLGPDGRLYVGVLRSGPSAGWVYRTAERLYAGAAEPGREGAVGPGLEVTPIPVRGEAEVTRTLAQPGAASVALYDGLGRQVAALHEGPLRAGRHALPLDGADLAP